MVLFDHSGAATHGGEACGYVRRFYSSFAPVREVSGESLLGGLLQSAGSLDHEPCMTISQCCSHDES